MPAANTHIYTNWSWYVLPYLEQDGLFRQINFAVALGGPNWQTVNGPALRTVVPTYQCPSDAGGLAATGGSFDGYPVANYAACHSPDGTWTERTIGPTPVNQHVWNFGALLAQNPATKVALFNLNLRRPMAAVSDGLSNTVVASEVVGGDFRGTWVFAHGVAYTHFRTPNATAPDAQWGPGCVDRPTAPCQSSAGAWGPMNMAARSKHAGGVNALLGDGSLRFVRNDVTPAVWRDAASIQAGEVPGDF